jgi:ABC-type transport system involved in cytochrome c biogenesis permease component
MIALIIRDLRISVRAGGGFGLSLAFFFHNRYFFSICDRP